MVVRYLDVFSAGCRPAKAHAVLVVHADAVLPSAVTFKCAISNCRSLRRTTDSILANRFTRLPFARASVSALLNDTITLR
jgi:hypothetical protein